MDIINILQSYSMPAITSICLFVGYLIKSYMDFLPNKYIPLVMTALGLIINIALNWGGITIEVILSGMVSGLSSTGIHNIYKNIVKDDSNEPDEPEIKAS